MSNLTGLVARNTSSGTTPGRREPQGVRRAVGAISCLLLLAGWSQLSAQLIPPTLPPPPTSGDFFSNFRKAEFLLPVGGDSTGVVGGDLYADYSRIFYKIDPDMELLIIGEYPRARYFSVTVYDDHGAIIDTILDQDIVPLLPQFGNPFAVGGPAGAEDRLYAITVRFGDTDLSAPLPECDSSVLDLGVNRLDARLRHTQQDRYTDDQSNFSALYGVLNIPHSELPDNTGGMIGVRSYLRGPMAPWDRYNLTNPLMWLRSVDTGCAYQISPDPGSVLKPEFWYDVDDVVNPFMVHIHNEHEADLGLVTPPDGIPQGNGVKFYGGNEYRFHDNPDTEFVTGLVGVINSPRIMNRDSRILRLDLKVPEVPCNTPVCARDGSEEVRYWSLSFIDDQDQTLFTLPDIDVVRDPQGYATIITTFGTELPDYVNADNGYTVVELLEPAALGFKWLTLRNILPNPGFGCSTAKVPFRTSEHHPNGGYMSDYLPFVSYPLAGALPEVANHVVADDESCEPPEVRPPLDCCGIAQSLAWESNEMRFTVWRTTDTDTRVIDWSTSDVVPLLPGNAEAGIDYTAASGTVTFLPGETKMSFTVQTLADDDAEGNETFMVNLTDADTGLPMPAGNVEGTIVDDDIPVFSFSFENPIEGGAAVITVMRDKDDPLPQSIEYTTELGPTSTAEAVDFQPTSGVLDFAPGELENVFSIPIAQDQIYEGNETFNIVISNVTGGTLGGNVQTATRVVAILDDDCCGVRDVSAFEGESLEFTVRRVDDETFQDIDYFTTDTGASAQDGVDYTGVSGRLSFLPGQVFKTVTVPLLQDALLEGNEIFQFNLADTGTGNIIEEGTVDGEILDDEIPLYTLSVAPVVEGNSFTVSVMRNLDTAPDTQTVDHVVRLRADDSAESDDFIDVPGTLTFGPGEFVKSYTIDTVQDAVHEGDEVLTPRVLNVIGGAFGGNVDPDDVKATIIDDDCCSASSQPASEGEGIEVTVTRADLSTLLSVDFTTEDDPNAEKPATANIDYVPVSGNLTFDSGGDTELTVVVPTLIDGVEEGNERLLFKLLDPSTDEVLEGGERYLRISDNELPVFDLSASDAIEGQPITATLHRNLDANETQTVRLVTEIQDQDSADVNDFFVESVTLSFEPGEMDKSFEVRTTDDAIIEGDETFTLHIFGVSGGPNGGNVGVDIVNVSIIDDD